jgi:beta-xylosidase
MKTDAEYFKIKNELIELKGLVREFIDAIEHVPFRAVDCDQESVYTLWNKLIKATGATNDRY